jgi:hypothetical protein
MHLHGELFLLVIVIFHLLDVLHDLQNQSTRDARDIPLGFFESLPEAGQSVPRMVVGNARGELGISDRARKVGGRLTLLRAGIMTPSSI